MIAPLTKEDLERAAKRIAEKRERKPPWRAVWNSSGPAVRLKPRPYRGKRERREVIKQRREAKLRGTA